MGSFRHSSFGPSPGLPSGVKWLLISSTAMYLLQFVLFHAFGQPLDFLKLTPERAVRGFLWQPFTYLFLHDVHSATHILWNMLSLFLIGPMLEGSWGTMRFLKYYLLCGMGAGLCVIIAGFAMGMESLNTIGCSGALFGLLIAYGVLFPDLLFFGIIKAKWLVMILGAVQILDAIAMRNSGISYAAHLGGMLVGFLLIRFGFLHGKSSGADPFVWLERRIREWRLARARRKFEVYMRKKGDR